VPANNSEAGTDEPLRIIGYVRVSTEEQAASGLGLHDQEAVLRAEGERRGWNLEIIVDAGASGSTLERPGLKAALQALARRDADGLIVAKLDRLSRSSTIDFLELMLWFEDVGARLVALDLGVDTGTPAGRLVATVLAAVAEWERETIRARTKAALAALRAQGKPAGRPPSPTAPRSSAGSRSCAAAAGRCSASPTSSTRTASRRCAARRSGRRAQCRPRPATSGRARVVSAPSCPTRAPCARRPQPELPLQPNGPGGGAR
jgi:DNA invertase Pin-like site-specific DNA recombinase